VLLRLSSQEVAENVLQKYGIVNEDQPLLAGLLIKRNRYYMHQERHFELYTNGQLKYSNANKEEKGILILTWETKVLKVGKNLA